jgi:hypothetical protein
MFKRGQRSSGRNSRGGGIIDSVKSGFEKIKSGFDKAKSLYTSNTGVALRNLVPQGNPDAKGSFSGEMHAVLQDPKSYTGYTTANWCGPGTSITKRLKRGDKGITEVDTISKAHDLRYALAKNDQKKIREADIRMINSVKKSKDSAFNKAVAGKIIEAKVLSEKLGIKNKFGESAPLSPEEEDLYTRELEKLETQGYGYRKLTRHANKVYEKDNKTKGHVKRLTDRPFKGSDGTKAMKQISKITLSGSGVNDVLDTIISTVVPSVMGDITKKYNIGKAPPKLVFDTKRLFMKNLANKAPSQYNQIISSTILPAVQKLMSSSLGLANKGGSMKGAGWLSDFADGFRYGFSATKKLFEKAPDVKGVPVSKIANALPDIAGDEVDTIDKLKERKRIRDKDEANRAQADLDEIEQKKNSRPLTEKEKENVKSFLENQKNLIAKLSGKGVINAGVRSKGKGVINAGVRSKGKGVINAGVRSSRSKGGEYNIEDIKEMAKLLTEKMKAMKELPKPESLLSKLKRYVPKVALGAVASLVAAKLYKKGMEKVADYAVEEGKNYMSDLWRTRGKLQTGSGKKKSKGKGVRTAGGKMKSDMDELKSKYNKLISKYSSN